MPVPLDCLILADDLTGACDAAAPFARRGRPTAVPIFATAPYDRDVDSSNRAGPPEAECRPAQGSGATVIAISTETRDAEPAAIRRRILEAASAWSARRPLHIFKKIDSTLRGRAGLEIAAALEAFACDAALVCPAFPQMNRTVEAGWLRVAGAGGFAPVEIVPYLRAQGVECCARASLETIAQALESGARLLALDAACDDDLDRIAAAGVALGRRILWAGSAGLAAALARTLPAAAPPAPARPAGPVLFCIGSDHPATLAQQAALLAQRRVRRVETGAEIRAALAAGAHALLRIPRGSFSPPELWDLLRAAPPAALALSGGDTAALVCHAAAAAHIRIHDEILPGIPAGFLYGGGFDGRAVATKSGGFGSRVL